MAGGHIVRASMQRGKQRNDGPDRDESDPNVQKTLDAIHEDYNASRPSVKSNYRPKQIEWHRYWVQEGNATDPLDEYDEIERSLEETARVKVTGAKMAVFLHNCVIGRGHKTRKGKKKSGNKNVSSVSDVCPSLASQRKVGYKTVDGYICAITNLWMEQERVSKSNEPSPREHESVKEIMRTAKHKTAAYKRSPAHDRLEGTLFDGYQAAEWSKICDEGLRRNNGLGLRDRLMAQIMHYGIGRGEDVRGLQLPDLQYMSLDNSEGFTEAHALVTVLLNGKTNQEGRTDFTGALRNKSWDVCPLGGLAMYLFWRFQISGERFGKDQQEFPPMDDPKQWNEIYVFPGSKTNTQPMKEEAHRKAEKAMLVKVGITSKKVTHIHRGSAARMAETLGASEPAIRKAGRWDASAMSQYYLTTLPREVMRVLAGFPAQPGSYWIARDIDPDPALEKLIFPQAQPWFDKLANSSNRSLAGKGFLTLLLKLRRILLQDCAFLAQTHPDHFLLRHQIFQSAAFKSFASKVVATACEQPPAELQLQAAMPQLTMRIDAFGRAVDGRLGQMDAHLRNVDDSLSQLADRSKTIDQRTGAIQRSSQADRQVTVAVLDLLKQVISGSLQTTFQPAVATAATASTHAADLFDGVNGALQASVEAAASSNHNHSTTMLPDPIQEQFCMDYTISRVTDMWEEYVKGRGGRASVKSMLERKLKKTDALRKLLGRRQPIIDAFEKWPGELILTSEEVVRRLENKRCELKKSITQIADMIKAKELLPSSLLA